MATGRCTSERMNNGREDAQKLLQANAKQSMRTAGVEMQLEEQRRALTAEHERALAALRAR
eukprot:SAG25_NODE_41_length_19492_cov_407.631671_9_plen_61_part_00